jgi:excisionase family DNA binding protein
MKNGKKRKIGKTGKRRAQARRSSLSPQQAAEHCEVSAPTLRRWIHDGSLATIRTPGGHHRIAVGEFQRFLREQHRPAYPETHGEVRVLVVDDDPLVVEFLVQLLRADPRAFKIETAGDGYEALIKVGAFQPSLLILDVVMPERDGIEVCRRIKTSAATRDIKILGLTGYPESLPMLAAAGADACLAKPFDLAEVERALDRLLPPR